MKKEKVKTALETVHTFEVPITNMFVDVKYDEYNPVL